MTKKRKAPSLGDDDVLVYCWFCEREFEDKIVLTAHQKAKHFTCQVCSKKLNSVAGLQNHLKTMHRRNLEVVANALTHRSDPTNVPDITGMDGIPAQDLQEYKSRTHPTAQKTTNLPNMALLKQFQPVKAEVPSKRAKIDTPLGAETIQAQLAEFQKKKEKQEIQDLQNQGILFPPGLPATSALALFAFRTPPPGTGLFAAKPNGPVTKDGKSDTLPTAALSSQSINSSLTSTSASASPKFVSKPAPPPSLKFGKYDTVLSLSPPTPAPLAPGQETHSPSPMSGMPNANNIATVGGQGSPTPPPNLHAGGGFGGSVGGGVQGGRGGRGGGKGRGFGGQQHNRGFRGSGQPGRGGTYPYPYQPPPMTPAAPFPNTGRGQFPPQFRPGQPVPVQQPYSVSAYPHQPPYPPQIVNQRPTPGGYPPQQYRPPQYPYPIPPQPYPVPPPQQYTVPPQGYIPRPAVTPPSIPPVPFEQLYPMHGKKASDLPPHQAFASRANPQGAVPGFVPPLSSSLTPGLPGQGGQRVDIRIITDDYVSPEEKLAAKYGYGKS